MVDKTGVWWDACSYVYMQLPVATFFLYICKRPMGCEMTHVEDDQIDDLEARRSLASLSKHTLFTFLQATQES